MAIEKNVITITEITRQIKFSLESSFPRVWVEGEISNFKQHTSGHFYFTLKDEGAQLSALMWRSRAANLTFQPEDGMKVIARGSITVIRRAEIISLMWIRFSRLELENFSLRLNV